MSECWEVFIIRSEVGENDVCLEGLGGCGGILLDTSADGIDEKAGYEDFDYKYETEDPFIGRQMMSWVFSFCLVSRQL